MIITTQEKGVDVLIKRWLPDDSFEFDMIWRKGRHKRVSPETWEDVKFLQSLRHNYEKFTPYHGDGIIVLDEIL